MIGITVRLLLANASVHSFVKAIPSEGVLSIFQFPANNVLLLFLFKGLINHFHSLYQKF